ncbi:MAG: leucine-rich repeat protein, partial [Lachnospiraceae bacterium]|nr:leucine-rich repeat protein [Lachnospiraceae bacterium]
GNDALSGIEANSLVLPNTLVSIGHSGFYGAKVPAVKVPEGVTYIGNYAFERCEMEEIELPSTLTRMGNNPFLNATKLKAIEIPGSLTTISDKAFRGCAALERVLIGEGVATLGGECFYGCSSLKELTLASTVKTIGGSCFYGCGLLTEIAIPEGVTKISSYTFNNCTALERVQLPLTLEGIYDRSFRNCTSLKEIDIPENVNYFDGYVFLNCTSMTKATIRSKAGKMSGYTFNTCTSLTSVEMAEGITSIGAAFTNCTSLRSIRLPESVEEIGSFCFQNCGALETIELPSNLKKIGRSCFNNCTSLAAIELPESVEEIGSSAFEGCSSLKSVTLPSKIKAVESNCFKNCAQMENIQLPEGLTAIRSRAFEGCAALAEIGLPETLTSIEGYAFYGAGLKRIVLPGQLGKIGELCFRDCKSLEEAVISDETKELGNSAFYGCTALQRLTIGRSISAIGNFAFYNCKELKKIVCRNLLPPTYGNGEFDSQAYAEAEFEVDASCEHLYRNHAVWGKFANIKATEFGYTTTFDLSEWETVKKICEELKANGWSNAWRTEIGPNVAEQLSGLTIEDGHVVGVSLANCKVNGAALAAMMEFPRLRSLNVSNNAIEGDIAELISEATVNENLTSLDISNNKFRGNIAWVNDRFPNLATLTANKNHFSRVEPALAAKTVNINDQEIEEPMRWTFGPMDKDEMVGLIPNILLYEHSSKSYKTSPSFNIISTENGTTGSKAITLASTLTGGVYNYKASNWRYNYIFKINEKYDLYLTVGGSSLGKAPVILDFVDGDCNCDATADIADAQNLVNYILGYGQNNKVFNEQVVDFDKNEKLNVLDVVGLVSHLLEQDLGRNLAKAPMAEMAEAGAKIYARGGKLVLEAVQDVSALDIAIRGGKGFALSAALKEAGFTCATKRQGGMERIIIYSASGAKLPEGAVELGTVEDAEVAKCEACTPEGEKIGVSAGCETSGIADAEAEAGQIAVSGRSIRVPARYNGGTWIVYDMAGMAIAQGAVSEGISESIDIAGPCVLVISKAGEESLSKKINM